MEKQKDISSIWIGLIFLKYFFMGDWIKLCSLTFVNLFIFVTVN